MLYALRRYVNDVTNGLKSKFSDACVSRYFNMSKNQAAANSTSSLDTANSLDHLNDQIVEDPLLVVC